MARMSSSKGFFGEDNLLFAPTNEDDDGDGDDDGDDDDEEEDGFTVISLPADSCESLESSFC